jgi:hypothetical protein
MFQALGNVVLLISWSQYAPGRSTLATKYGPSQGGDNLCLPFLLRTHRKTMSPTWKAQGCTLYAWYHWSVC